MPNLAVWIKKYLGKTAGIFFGGEYDDLSEPLSSKMAVLLCLSICSVVALSVLTDSIVSVKLYVMMILSG